VKVSFVDLSDRIVGSSLTALALLRVAQEALMNVHRHARAMHVRMSLAWRRGLLELVIRDDGIGIPDTGDIGSPHGVGMVGMRHRVERIGGNFTVKRMKHGTKLVASVPLG
jgi:signal transduction histidine kinase